MSVGTSMFLVPIISIGLLILLTTRLRLHPFLALTLSAGFLGLASGLPPADVIKTFEKGFGGILSSLGLIVGLGTMLGGLLLETGGADKIATVFVDMGSKRWVPVAICAAALLIGMPHLFDVSFVMLVPLLFAISKRVEIPIMNLGIPMTAGLMVSHTILPPHPAPSLAMTAYHADPGRTIFYGLIMAIPMALITGPLLSRVVAHWWPVTGSFAGAEQMNDSHSARTSDEEREKRRTPGLAVSLISVLIPPGLMMLRSFGQSHFSAHSTFRTWLDFAGDPIISLLIAVMFAFHALGIRSGLNLSQIQQLLRKSVGPAAGIILILGAGGGLKELLAATHISDRIAQMILQSGISPLIMAWVAGAVIRIFIGSATVATITAAGMMAPLAAASPNVNLELMALATSSGAQMLSHVNDTGFWLFKEYFKLSVGQTLRSWTLLGSLQSILGLIGVLLLNAIFR